MGYVCDISNLRNVKRGFCYRQVVLSMSNSNARSVKWCVYVFANDFNDFRIVSNAEIGDKLEFSVQVESYLIKDRWCTFIKAFHIVNV